MKQLPTMDFNEVWEGPAPHIRFTKGAIVQHALGMLQQHCHAASYNRGWWLDPVTWLSLIPGEPDVDGDLNIDQLEGYADSIIKAWFPYVIATKIALIHSEVSEMLESVRTGAWDDKIAYPGITAEGADIVIRVFDLLGMLQAHPQFSGYRMLGPNAYEAFNLAGAMLAKIPFNSARVDHSLDARKAPGGKKY